MFSLGCILVIIGCGDSHIRGIQHLMHQSKVQAQLQEIVHR